MKTKILAVLLISLQILPVLGQRNEKRLSFGLTAGPQVSWMHADEEAVTTGPVRIGFEGGARLDYRFLDYYAFSIGANWMQTGGNLVYRDPFVINLPSGLDSLMAGTRLTYRLQYVEVPVAIKFIAPEIGYSTWYADIGIDPLFRTDSRVSATDNNIDKMPFDGGTATFNLAFHAGIGMDYSLGGPLCLRFGILYRNTFLDVTREEDIRKADNTRINSVSLTAGICF